VPVDHEEGQFGNLDDVKVAGLGSVQRRERFLDVVGVHTILLSGDRGACKPVVQGVWSTQLHPA
jgi:hypothetical protein